MANFSRHNFNFKRAFVLVLALTWPSAALAAAEGLTLAGNVHTSDGKVLAGVVLRILDAKHALQQQSVTDASGRFKFDGLLPGEYSLEAKLDGFATLERAVQLNTEPLSIDLVMARSTPAPAHQSSSESRNPNSSDNSSRQAGTRRPRRGFQTLTLQTPENLDASQNESGTPGASAPSPSAGDVGSRSSDAVLIQGSVSSDSANSPFGEGLSEDRIQEIRDRIREGIARGDFPGRGGFGGRGGAGGDGGGPGGGGFGGPFGGGGGFGGLGGGGGGGFGGRGGFGRFGANRIRGSFFEDYRNSVFDARPFSFSGIEQSKQQYLQNSFGAMVGGPLNIPHVYK